MICNTCGNKQTFYRENTVIERALYNGQEEFMEVLDADTVDSGTMYCNKCNSTDLDDELDDEQPAKQPATTGSDVKGSGGGAGESDTSPSSTHPSDVWYCAHAIDPEGHVVTEFDTRELLYHTPEDLAKLVELCKEHHRSYQYLTHEILALGSSFSGVTNRWKRRVHPQEEEIFEKAASGEISDHDFDNFITWLREHAETGEEPGIFDPKAYQSELQRRRRRSQGGTQGGTRDPDVPF